jgi:uncharacterized membrane protein
MSLEYLIEVISRYINNSPYDLLALLWFLACWASYSIIIDNFLRSSRGLSARMHLYRIQWMITALQRENRVVETNIIQSYQYSISFFASTAILIIAGLLAMLSASSTAIAIIKQIPFVVASPKMIWYSKNFLLIYLFIYAFFKLTWALRQLNYCTIMIGALPLVKDPQKVYEYAPAARRVAMVATMAVKDMNRGIRAYYFAIAVLAWFMNPLFFMIATAWVMIVLYRREFKSRVLHVLAMPAKAVPNSLQNTQTHQTSSIFSGDDLDD